MLTEIQMDCLICAEPFNRSRRKITECHHCFFKACQDCVATYLLQKDQAGCMNCHKQWDYVFLSTQMNKTFLQKRHKEHIKTVLIRDIEADLADYQEIATTTNDKEKLSKELINVRDRLSVLEDQQMNHVAVDVVVGERRFHLYHNIRRQDTPESRYGALMINYVEGLVNPPPTEQDVALAKEEEKKLIRNVSHHQFMYSCAILDKNVFGTDKLVYAMSPVPLMGETLETLKTQLDEKKAGSQVLYEQYVNDRENTQPSLNHWIHDFRKLYQKYWGHYFYIHPATPADLNQIQKENDRYSSLVENRRTDLLDAMWEKDDVFSRFHSNKKYLYNLDDQQLYCARDQQQHAQDILEKEEKRWHHLVRAHQDEMAHLLPIYKDLYEKHKILNRKLRLLKKNKTVSGIYISPCPRNGCLGKLADDGECGLCHHVFCHDCMKEKTKEHECLKEDKETIAELRRTTRPCPKCSVLIYKIEGCDQMWCVKCHTTFSWKTGAISQGVVHNPHFYQERQQAMRTPGDIPCGGLPNEIEILLAISRCVENRAVMYDMWDYCDRVAEQLMPCIYKKFNNVRAVKYRRLSIAYMRGKINKKQLGSSLFRIHMDEIRYAHYYGFLETFVDNMAEYMRQFVSGLNTERECQTLLTLLEQDIQHMNKTLQMNEIFHSPI
jgi:hypothetical protein